MTELNLIFKWSRIKPKRARIITNKTGIPGLDLRILLRGIVPDNLEIFAKKLELLCPKQSNFQKLKAFLNKKDVVYID